VTDSGLDVAAVAAELEPAPAAGDGCPATHELGDVTLGCALRDPRHAPPHRDPRGLAWDDSVVTRAWPVHAAAWIVAELLDAGQAWVDAARDLDTAGGQERLARYEAAAAVAAGLPGVAEQRSA
jgi:hypothetical protein